MSLYIIPIENETAVKAFRFSVELNGSDYQFEFQFNTREGYWYFDLLTYDNVMIKSGIKVVVNYPLLRTVKTTIRPSGELIFLDSRATEIIPATDPGLIELGTDVFLFYDEV